MRSMLIQTVPAVIFGMITLQTASAEVTEAQFSELNSKVERLLSRIEAFRNDTREAVPVGSIVPYAGSAAIPQGYIVCDGSAVPQATYRKLFDVIGFTYTPEAERQGPTFKLPDLRGRTIVGRDNMGAPPTAGRITTAESGIDGTTLGSVGGQESVRLEETQIPAHSHAGTTRNSNRSLDHSHPIGLLETSGRHMDFSFTQFAGGAKNTTMKLDADSGYGRGSTQGHSNDLSNHTHSFRTDSTGGSQTHMNVQPSIILNYMIKYTSESPLPLYSPSAAVMIEGSAL